MSILSKKQLTDQGQLIAQLKLYFNVKKQRIASGFKALKQMSDYIVKLETKHKVDKERRHKYEQACANNPAKQTNQQEPKT